ncbi:MAG: U32 family peptidase [Spirochaetales bacterium]|nr:U32 family peptidase [Spirochaetales bacterium]MCF7937397.1 U32 family peptidase [Spirochaetales bacterium]
MSATGDTSGSDVNKPQRPPELLAPAGTLESALAAFEAGADAVYAGLSRFNAREMGRNFDWDDLSRLSAYTKEHGKRFHLTFNTLIKDGELEEAAEDLAQVMKLEPDAVIIQDLGVLRLLRERWPETEIHASTQMGTHNSAGVELLSRLGVGRVILERQVSLDELESITTAVDTEIEVFVHGALCCSLSGNCLFSSWIGGWSGNRGKCKQPCRRRYYRQDDEGNKESGFLFSPDDLSFLDMLDHLTRLGVASFKIEGRLKKPDYVSRVVRAYRMVLDSVGEDPGSRLPKEVLSEAKNVLAGSFGRRWSHGFATEADKKELVNPAASGVSGLLVGRVRSVTADGFTAELSRPVNIGDRLRIQPKQGEEGPSFTVVKMKQLTEPQKTSSSGRNKSSLVYIESRAEVQAGNYLYKIGESVAGLSVHRDRMPLFQPRIVVDLEIGFDGKRLETAYSVRDRQETGGRRSFELESEPARNRPLEKEQLETLFRQTRTSWIRAGRIEAAVEGDWFVPASRLKTIRRTFWEWASGQIEKAGEKDAEVAEGGAWSWKELLANRTDVDLPADKAPPVCKRERFAEGGAFKGVVCVPIHNIDLGRSVELELPFFCPETGLEDLGNRLKQAYEKGFRSFRVTALYQFELFRSNLAGAEDLQLSTSFPLQAANSLAVSELHDLGARRVQAWIELESEAIQSIIRNAGNFTEIEQYRYGAPHIFVTRAELAGTGWVTDSRGKRFYLEYDEDPAMYILYPDRPVEQPALDGAAFFFDKTKYDHPELGKEEQTSSFLFDTELV